MTGKTIVIILLLYWFVGTHIAATMVRKDLGNKHGPMEAADLVQVAVFGLGLAIIGLFVSGLGGVVVYYLVLT